MRRTGAVRYLHPARGAPPAVRRATEVVMSVVTRAAPEGGAGLSRGPLFPHAPRRPAGPAALPAAAAEPAQAPPVAGPWLVRNLTPRPIWIEGEHGRLFTLGPLESRPWPESHAPELGTAGEPWVAFPPLVRLIDRHQL